ncbi:hypothetical protein ACQCVP_09750 [Rossellomorea vietnamensis]
MAVKRYGFPLQADDPEGLGAGNKRHSCPAGGRTPAAKILLRKGHDGGFAF